MLFYDDIMECITNILVHHRMNALTFTLNLRRTEKNLARRKHILQCVFDSNSVDACH